MKRIVGLETEYGCLTSRTGESRPIPERVRDYLFYKLKVGLIDLHDRDYDEPAGNGGFLFNGGRLYLDMGHVEYCTAECLNLADLVASDDAGERLLQQALDELGLSSEACFVKNNVDHYTGATFGCHENYLVSRDGPFNQRNLGGLLSFLALRGLMVGAGRVGGLSHTGRRSGRGSGKDSVPFQIMQRADYIQTEVYEWVQFNRALINARDEPLGDPTRFRRLHLLLGDSNVLPFSNALKVGATSLLLDLVEADLIPKGLALADPVRSMRQISYDPDGSWIVEMADGRKWSALDVLGELYEVAASPKLDKDQDGLWTCRAWEEVLVAFQEKRKEDLIGKVDWVTKRYLLEAFREAEGLEWDDPWLESLDLEYHKIDPAQNLARLLPNTGVTDVDLPGYPKQDPRYFPPANTRAKVRSQLMHTIAQTGRDYIIDWDYVQFGKLRYFTLDDPFESRVPELEWKRAWA